MSTKQLRRPGRQLLVLLLLIALGFGALAVGAATGRTSMTPGLALDLEGGTQIILTPTTSDGSAISDEDIEQAIGIIRQRVDASGVSEAQISRQGGQNIVVSLPGTPSEETLALVRTSAVLYFRPVIRTIRSSAAALAEAQNQYAAQAQASASAEASAAAAAGGSVQSPFLLKNGFHRLITGGTPIQTTGAQPTATAEDIARTNADVNGDGTISSDPLPSTSEDNSSDSWISEQLIYDAYMTDCKDPANLTGTAQDPTVAVISCARDGQGATYILGPADIAGTDIAKADSSLEVTSQGVTTNNWVVNLEFNSQGTQTFSEVSSRLIGYRDAAPATTGTSTGGINSPASVNSAKAQFAIVLDGLTLMASGFNKSVTTGITDGKVQISGGFTQESANTLANQLSFGSLPLTFTVQSEQAVSATLGTEQLRNGLIAGLVGFLLIIVYLTWQYRGLSVIAVASLLVAAAVTYLAITLLSWGMGYRLSLAGVAGLIISIGITMDSFIIYFERVRDEVRSGRTLVAAVNEGWLHARRTIVVSDAVNLVAAVVLYFLAVGGVQGFAFTLGVTTIVDLGVIILFTHPMMVWILRLPFFGQGHRLSGLDPEHLGARSQSVYGRGRQALADAAATSLARRKAARAAESTGGGADAVAAPASSRKEGEDK
ncbi:MULTISPECIES: protein translocase subunit SecD [Actinomyces]|uniref:Protein translocase subunit SecD n=1 Tax=Actinomyces respiraculi TaxID=2744574 RepID=A0A7T0LMB1_9ACTO|nr:MULTISPECIES: protein translocase subunit SecD [Actinomyces]QPL06412.1 protein translocase subunit SecD [Actinomyces respiraculi]